MATRGFEFARSYDGSTPVIEDFPVDGTGAYAIGDLCLVNSDGQLAKVTGSTTEVTAVIQEARASGADGDKLKAAVITSQQVWRCSTAAATTSAKAFYDKTVDTVDHNTIDGADLSNGRMMPVDVSQLDDDGNVLMYVVFRVPSLGNALS
jgi:hypothetical protein